MQDSPAIREPRICAATGCATELRSDNSIGYCRSHLTAASRAPVRVCADSDCGYELRVTNKTGYCAQHRPKPQSRRDYEAAYNAMLRERTAGSHALRSRCSARGCENVLRPDNRSGFCQTHRGRANGPSPSNRAQCAIEGCSTLLDPRNEIGRCVAHRAKLWVAATCAADGCEKTINGKNLTGFCPDHTNGYRRDQMLRRLYGITEEQYEEMLTEQGGCCALCGKPPKPGGKRNAGRLHVDHDHATGRVRRLLCNNCNHGLGTFFDDPDLMRRAADYIERFRQVAVA